MTRAAAEANDLANSANDPKPACRNRFTAGGIAAIAGSHMLVTNAHYLSGGLRAWGRSSMAGPARAPAPQQQQTQRDSHPQEPRGAARPAE
jgi:hypothetical protein